MARVALLTSGALIPESGRVAGLQIRVFEMACALARRGHSVTVGEGSPSHGMTADLGLRLEPLSKMNPREFDVWVCHPLQVGRYRRRFADVPLVVDGYEAPFASFLSYGESRLGTVGRRGLFEYGEYISRILRALRAADLVLCANEAQRIGYLSLMGALGKLSPTQPSAEIVQIVQSGAPVESPEDGGPALIDKRGPTVLWAGGVYPWFDLETFVRAVPLIQQRVPDAQFVFAGLGGVDQGQADPETQPGIETLRRNASLAPAVHLVDWLPYTQRGRLYRSADLVACTYRSHVETLFSMRTRVIDAAWGGLPVVATRGDSVSSYLEQYGAARTVTPGQAEELASVVAELLLDERRRTEMANAARSLADGPLSWDVQIEELHRFCSEPRHVRSMKGDPCASIVRVNRGRLWWLLARMSRAGLGDVVRVLVRLTRGRRE